MLPYAPKVLQKAGLPAWKRIQLWVIFPSLWGVDLEEFQWSNSYWPIPKMTKNSTQQRWSIYGTTTHEPPHPIPKNHQCHNFIQFPHQDFAQNLTGTKSFGMVQWNYRTIAFCSDGRRCGLPKFLSNEGCEKEIIDHAWPWMDDHGWPWMTMDDHGHLGLELGDLYFMCGAMSEKQFGGWEVLWHILMPWIWGTPIWILRHGDAMGHIFPRHKQWRPSKRSTSTSRDKQTALGHHLQQWLNIMNRPRFSRYVWPPINHGFSYFWSPNGAGDDWDADDFAQEP